MHTSQTLCHIDNHSLLLVKGPDARKFLQGQVTCDIDELSIKNDGNTTQLQSTLGAHCTHKGRIVFSFRAIALDEETIALNIPSEMIDIATTALQKYIVFSKAEIINAHKEYQLIGIHSDHASDTIHTITGMTSLPTIPNTAISSEDGLVLCLEHNRYELWLNATQAARYQTQLKSFTFENSQHWDFKNINSGLAEIRQTTSGLFTPHAINFQDTASAVSFQKGCYTGQEVVARMHYLGKLKRQMFLFEISSSVESTIAAGDPVYTTEKTQSIGDIVLVAQSNHITRLLVSATVEQVEKDQVYLDTNNQQKLEHIPFSH